MSKRTEYDKAIRDKIPDRLTSRGIEHSVRRVEPGEFQTYLTAKLQEECDEFTAEPSLEELADVFEVTKALAASLGFSFDDLVRAANQKVAERGGFEHRLILDFVDE